MRTSWHLFTKSASSENAALGVSMVISYSEQDARTT